MKNILRSAYLLAVLTVCSISHSAVPASETVQDIHVLFEKIKGSSLSIKKELADRILRFMVVDNTPIQMPSKAFIEQVKKMYGSEAVSTLEKGRELFSINLKLSVNKLSRSTYSIIFPGKLEPVLSGHVIVSEAPGYPNKIAIALMQPGLISGYLTKDLMFGFVVSKSKLLKKSVMGDIIHEEDIIGAKKQFWSDYKKGNITIPFSKAWEIMIYPQPRSIKNKK